MQILRRVIYAILLSGNGRLRRSDTKLRHASLGDSGKEMARLPIASVAVAVLLIGACITLGYLALLHADSLESTAAASKAVPVRPTVLQRMKRRLSGKPDPCAGLSDFHTDCQMWAQQGECSKNPGYMMESCQRACNSTCVKAAAESVLGVWSAIKDGCTDNSNYCGQWAAVGECDSNPHYMKTQCRVTCGLCQSAACHDVNVTRCKAEAAAGLCRSEPERMYRDCRWACSWCAMTTSKTCLRAKDQKPAAWAGSVESMFTRAADTTLHGHYAPRVLSRSPWVVAFDSFLSDAECDRVIKVAGRHFARSVAGDGVQSVRTSSTAWCSPGACQSDPTMTEIRARIANLTTVPARNAEHMQVLRYETGQFYKVRMRMHATPQHVWKCAMLHHGVGVLHAELLHSAHTPLSLPTSIHQSLPLSYGRCTTTRTRRRRRLGGRGSTPSSCT